MPDISEHNDYKKHFAGFSDANLEVFLKSGHSNVSMVTAATEEVHKRRRAESTAHNEATEPAYDATNNTNDWYEMPLGKIAIGVATTIIGACVLFLITTHFDIKLN
jgi:hypothetical protein